MQKKKPYTLSSPFVVDTWTKSIDIDIILYMFGFFYKARLARAPGVLWSTRDVGDRKINDEIRARQFVVRFRGAAVTLVFDFASPLPRMRHKYILPALQI